MKKTIFALIFSALLLSSFFGCGKKQEEQKEKEFNGVPDNVISRSSQTEAAVTPPSEENTEAAAASGEEQSVTDSEASVPPNSDTDTAETSPADSKADSQSKSSKAKSSAAPTENKKPEGSETEPEDDVFIEDDEDWHNGNNDGNDNASVAEQETMAMKYLKILNSSKVHAVLIEAETMDGVEISSVEREYYIDGKKAIYINDHQKIIMTEDTVTVIDTEENTYYTYPRDGEDGDVFGYSPSSYELQSVETDANGNVTEVYSVSTKGKTIKSTWVFSPTGKVSVMDESVDFGSFRWYRFDIISKDISGMDMSLPDGLELIEPEDII